MRWSWRLGKVLPRPMAACVSVPGRPRPMAACVCLGRSPSRRLGMKYSAGNEAGVKRMNVKDEVRLAGRKPLWL